LDPEFSRTRGPMPIFLDSQSGDVITNLFDTKSTVKPATFGADQAILVRDARAKAQLEGIVDALVLTAIEAKVRSFLCNLILVTEYSLAVD